MKPVYIITTVIVILSLIVLSIFYFNSNTSLTSSTLSPNKLSVLSQAGTGEYPLTVQKSGGRYLILKKDTGLEKYLVESKSWSFDEDNLYINLTINASRYLWFQDTYNNWATYTGAVKLAKCNQLANVISEDYPNFDCLNTTHQTLLLTAVQNFVTLGFNIKTLGIDKGYVEVVGNKVLMTIPLTWLEDKGLIELGENSIVYEYQDINLLNYQDTWFDVNISLSCEDVPQNDIWVRHDADKDKFGANGTFEGVTSCKYIVNSNSEIVSRGLIPYIRTFKQNSGTPSSRTQE